MQRRIFPLLVSRLCPKLTINRRRSDNVDNSLNRGEKRADRSLDDGDPALARNCLAYARDGITSDP